MMYKLLNNLAECQKEHDECMTQLENIERSIQELNKQGQDLVTKINVLIGNIEALNKLKNDINSDESEVVENGEQN